MRLDEKVKPFSVQPSERSAKAHSLKACARFKLPSQVETGKERNIWQTLAKAYRCRLDRRENRNMIHAKGRWAFLQGRPSLIDQQQKEVGGAGRAVEQTPQPPRRCRSLSIWPALKRAAGSGQTRRFVCSMFRHWASWEGELRSARAGPGTWSRLQGLDMAAVVRDHAF